MTTSDGTSVGPAAGDDGVQGQPIEPVATPTVEPSTSPMMATTSFWGNELSAWTVAVAPFLGLLVSAAIASQAGASVADTAGWVVYAALNTLVVWWDKSSLRRLNLPSPPWGWGIFLMPVYLWKRQRTLGRLSLPVLIWVASFLATAFLQSTVLNGAAASQRLQLNAGVLEQQIQQRVESKISSPVTVACPAETLHKGLQFQCLVTVSSDGSTAIAAVTVQNNAGFLIWQIQNSL